MTMEHALLATTLCILFAGSTRGDTSRNILSPWYMQDYDEKWWRFELLLGFEIEPTYPGSDETEEEVGGLIRGILKDPWNNRYTVGLEGVSGAFDLTKDLVFFVQIEQEEGDEGESADLDGLDQVRDTVEGQFTLGYRIGNAYGFGAIQPDLLDRGKGIVYFAGVGYDWQITDPIGLRQVLLLSGGNNTHMNTEFDITPTEAKRTGFRVYNPDAGLKTLEWQIQAEYAWTDHISLMALADLEYYLGDAAESPLVRDIGSDTTAEVLGGVLFRW